jgi:hypothetical protein
MGAENEDNEDMRIGRTMLRAAGLLDFSPCVHTAIHYVKSRREVQYRRVATLSDSKENCKELGCDTQAVSDFRVAERTAEFWGGLAVSD